MPEEISKEEISTTKDPVAVVDKELEEKKDLIFSFVSKEEEYDFKTHVEIKEYQVKAKETVRGSARHSSKFSNERAIVEDTRKQIDVLTKLSDHVADLEKRVTLLEGGSKDEEPKK